MTASDVNSYLERIGYRGERAPTEAVLRELHLAHLYAVPFENLDISRGIPIQLDSAALFAKIVTRRRGGFCYELNGLFAELLRALGFAVTLLSAGVGHETGGFGPDFDHLTLRVDLDTPWLVDVGFGESFREPLRLDSEEIQAQGAGGYRIIRDGAHRLLVRRGIDGEKPQYRFSLEPRALPDFAGMCLYHQTSPLSHFTQKRVCTMATPEGRVTLSGRRLIVTRSGTREEVELADEEAVASALWTYFGIELDPEALHDDSR
jgi:N-hydroxyarylamine O-acetyltransferase